MTDKRELILSRLVEVLSGIKDFKSVYRNKVGVEERLRPSAMVFDADEEKAALPNQDIRRKPSSPMIMTMRPEVYIVLGDKPENVGTKLNALRAKVLHSVMTDATLAGLCLHGDGPQYEAAATSLAAGRSMEAEMKIDFSFTYVFKPSDLA